MAQKTGKRSYREVQAELDRELAKGRYRPAYLICGEQDYLRHENIRKIQTALLGDGDPMNSTVLTGPQVRAAEVLEIAQTLPFLSDRRVVTMTETEFLRHPGEEAEKLCTLLDELPETTHLIFEEPSPNKTYRLYKKLEKVGLVLCCDLAAGEKVQAGDLQQLRAWICELFEKEGLAISNPTANLFLEYSGTDMLAILSQKDKVAAYCWGRKEVLPQDIRSICTPVVKDRIFDMIRFTAEGKRREAMNIYMDLLQLQTPPQVVLSLMTRQYNQLLQIRELSEKLRDDEIAKTVKVNPWALTNRLKPLAARYSAEQLERLLERCMDADYTYKSGRITPQLAAERLIVQCSGESG